MTNILSIGIGSSPNDTTGDPLRTSMTKIMTAVNGLAGFFNGTTAPASPPLYLQWFDTSTSPPTLRYWDGAQWVAAATLDSSSHTFSVTIGALSVTNAKMAVGAAAANVGSIGGDLTGTLPNPTISKIQGIAVSGVTGTGNAVLSAAPTLSALRGTGVSTLGATGWLEPIVPNTESLATTRTLSTNGFIGVVGATRSSDNSGPGGAQGSIGITGISINDNTAFVQSGFAGYFEARRSATAGGVEGIESTVLNYGTNVSINPYAMVATGQTMSLWLAAGRPDVSSATGLVSTAVGIIQNGTYSQFDKGIIFGANSVLNGKAIEFPSAYSISWREATTSTITSKIRCDGTTAGIGQSLIFTDTGFFIQDIGLTNIASFTLSATTILAGTFNVVAGGIQAPVSANGSVATVLGSLGPTGSHTTVQEWIQIKGTGGAVRYIPAF